MKNLFTLIFLIIFSSCGYNSVLKNTSDTNDYKVNIIKMEGDQEINNIIKKQLELQSNENSKKNFGVSLETDYNQTILSKNTSGAITNYQITVNTTFKVNFKNQSIDFNFNESLKMKNISDSLEKLSYEKNIKNNLDTHELVYIIIKYYHIKNSSNIDTTKPHSIIQSNDRTDGHDQAIKKHLLDEYKKAKEAGDKDEEGNDPSPSNGPWRVGLDLPRYIPLQTYAKDRRIREKVYRAFVSRASDGKINNKIKIVQISINQLYLLCSHL